jgi:ATP-binding cassette subfamily C (CFTR/MRP) protein 5
MDDADVGLPTTLEQLLQNSSLILVSIGLVIVVFPYFLVALVPIFIVYRVIVNYSRPSQVHRVQYYS